MVADVLSFVHPHAAGRHQHSRVGSMKPPFGRIGSVLEAGMVGAHRYVARRRPQPHAKTHTLAIGKDDGWQTHGAGFIR